MKIRTVDREIKKSLRFTKTGHGYVHYNGDDIDPIDELTYNKMRSFLDKMLEVQGFYDLCSNYNLSISLLSNSIDISFSMKDKKFRFLVNIKKDGITWYGYSTVDYTTKPFTYLNETSSKFENAKPEDFINWLKQRVKQINS